MNSEHWPETVPYLRESNMSNLVDEGCRHCAIGWRYAIFGRDRFGYHCDKTKAAMYALIKSARALYLGDIGHWRYVEWTARAPLSHLAAVWNHAMPSLGGDRPYVYDDIRGCFARQAKVPADSRQPKELEPCLT